MHNRIMYRTRRKMILSQQQTGRVSENCWFTSPTKALGFRLTVEVAGSMLLIMSFESTDIAGYDSTHCW